MKPFALQPTLSRALIINWLMRHAFMDYADAANRVDFVQAEGSHSIPVIPDGMLYHGDDGWWVEGLR